jgi:hypothetical protein
MDLDEVDKLVPVLSLKEVVESMASGGYTVPILAPYPDKSRAIGETWASASKETIQSYSFWRIITDLVSNEVVVAHALKPLRLLLDQVNNEVRHQTTAVFHDSGPN